VFYKMRLPALYCRSQWIGSQCAPFEPHRGSWNSRRYQMEKLLRCGGYCTVQHHARGPDAHRPLASSPPSTSTSFCLRAHLCVHLLMSVPCRAADRSDLPWFRSLMVYKFFSPSFQLPSVSLMICLLLFGPQGKERHRLHHGTDRQTDS
jgi:hypothetical protein